MIIPIRCFTCNHVLADKWKWFERECEKLSNTDEGEGSSDEGTSAGQKKKRGGAEQNKVPAKNMEVANRAKLLDQLGLKRLCCRRHMLGHVDMMELI